MTSSMSLQEEDSEEEDEERAREGGALGAETPVGLAEPVCSAEKKARQTPPFQDVEPAEGTTVRAFAFGLAFGFGWGSLLQTVPTADGV